jgi:hypothetical protein
MKCIAAAFFLSLASCCAFAQEYVVQVALGSTRVGAGGKWLGALKRGRDMIA